MAPSPPPLVMTGGGERRPSASSRMALVAPAPRRPITLMRKQQRSRHSHHSSHSHHLSHLHSFSSLGSIGQDGGVDAVASSVSPSSAYRSHPYLATGPPSAGVGRHNLLSVLARPASSEMSNGTNSGEGGSTASPAFSHCSSSTPTVASSSGTQATSHPNTPAHLHAQAGRRRSSLLSVEELQQGCSQALSASAQNLVGLGIAAEKISGQKRQSHELLSPDWRPSAALYDYDDDHRLPSPLSVLSENVETGAPTAVAQLGALQYPLSPIARSKHLRNPLERRLHQSTSSRNFTQGDDDELMSSESDEERADQGSLLSQKTGASRAFSPSLRGGLPESKLLQKFLRSGAAASLLAYFDEQQAIIQHQHHQHRKEDSQHCRSASLPSPQDKSSGAAILCDQETDIVDMDYSFDTI